MRLFGKSSRGSKVADRPHHQSVGSRQPTTKAAPSSIQKLPEQALLSVGSPTGLSRSISPSSTDSENSNIRRFFRRNRGKEVPPGPEPVPTDTGGQPGERHHDGGSVAQPRIGDPSPDPEEPSTSQTLWDRAYDALKDEAPEKVDEYENLLAKELQDTSTY